MYIRCWGSRGQIPVSGAEYNKYGGDTTCLEIRSNGGELIIIDAGSGIRHLGARLLEEKQRKINLIFTHLHLDHILGLPFFGPVYDRQTLLTIYGCPFNISNFQEALHGMMQAPYFPVDLNNLPCKIHYKDILSQSFKIGSVRIKPIPLNHPNGGLGFRIEENGAVFVFLTDNELGYDLPGAQPFEAYRDFSEGADLLIHDAEFNKEEYVNYKAWGHSRFTDAVELAVRAGVKRLGLFHINNKRTDRQVDGMVRESCRLIARRGASVSCTAIGNTFEIQL
ncbi:MAG: MBL fold metallo-hydrolase [Chitinispirillaceae bacterium]|nr:MBL fold metallo-hydrolase [Chitinispirillaceae bacterium]